MTGLEWGNAVLILALAAILLMALFFVFCRRYEDGVVGNVALVFMSIACGILLWDAWRDRFVPPDPVWCLLVLCFAIFQLRHGYRFAMFHWHGFFGWRKPQDHGRGHPKLAGHDGNARPMEG